MPRKRTGTLAERDGYFAVRVLLNDGTYSSWIRLPAGLSRAEAEVARADLAAAAARGEITRKGPPPRAARGVALPSSAATTDAWFDAWLEHRRSRGHTTTDDDRGRWSKWIAGRLGGRLMRDVTRADLEDLVNELDDRVAAGQLSWKTARNAWGVVTKMFDDAATSKNRALRVREDNPASAVKPPDRGAEKALSWLYPREALQLFQLERSPLRWRRLFAVAAYTYARQGELEALEWGDVDFDARTVHIHRAVERKSGEVQTVKTERPRRIPLERELLPLLVFMIGETKGDRVLDMPTAGDIPERLRQYMRWAGLAREELFTSDATRRAFRFHDMRATGTTWLALRGDDPLKIQARAGHRDLATTMRYIRAVDVLGEDGDIGEPFPPLPESLLVPIAESAEGPKVWGRMGGIARQTSGVPSGIRSLSGALVGVVEPEILGVSEEANARDAMDRAPKPPAAVFSLAGSDDGSPALLEVARALTAGAFELAELVTRGGR